jgi:ribosomal protein L30E
MSKKLECDLAMTSNLEYDVQEKLECVTQGEIMINPNSTTILAITPTKIKSVVIATNCNSWNKILFTN